jgi:hypothetical protein
MTITLGEAKIDYKFRKTSSRLRIALRALDEKRPKLDSVEREKKIMKLVKDGLSEELRSDLKARSVGNMQAYYSAALVELFERGKISEKEYYEFHEEPSAELCEQLDNHSRQVFQTIVDKTAMKPEHREKFDQPTDSEDWLDVDIVEIEDSLQFFRNKLFNVRR